MTTSKTSRIGRKKIRELPSSRASCFRLLRAPAQLGRFALIFERRLFEGHPLTWRLNFDVGGFCMALLNAAESIDGSLRVVAIGGGTGLSTLLRGLKREVVTPERREGIRIGEAPRIQSAAYLGGPSW